MNSPIIRFKYIKTTIQLIQNNTKMENSQQYTVTYFLENDFERAGYDAFNSCLRTKGRCVAGTSPSSNPSFGLLMYDIEGNQVALQHINLDAFPRNQTSITVTAQSEELALKLLEDTKTEAAKILTDLVNQK